MTTHRDLVFELLVPGTPHPLSVVSFEGREQMSSPYAFEILAVGPEISPEIIDEAYIGSPAHLRFGADEEHEERWVHGILRRVEAEGVSGDRDGARHHYRLWLVPSLWLLGRSRASRIFQDKSVPEIARTVLGEGGVRLRFALARSYARRSYCVQHQESDRRFVERLLAEEGIFYFFEQPGGESEAEIMVLADSASACGPIAGDPALIFRDSSGMREDGGDVRRFRLRRRALPGSVLLSDFDFTRPAYDNSRSASVDDLPDPLEGLSESLIGAAPGVLRAPLGRALDELQERAEGALPWSGAVDSVRREGREARRAARRAERLARGGVSSIAQEGRRAAQGLATRAARQVASQVGLGEVARVIEDAAGLVQEPIDMRSPDDTEVYDHHGEQEASRIDDRAASTYLEQERRKLWIGVGEGRCHRLQAGYRFELRQAAIDSHDGAYVVFRVEHHGRDPRYGAPAGEASPLEVYRCAFQCVPGGTAFRPKRPRRRIQQVMETAIVVGPSGLDIHTDEHGRIKVQFHWDRQGKRNEHSSCWIRVMQPWAGPGWGFQFIPRIGMEVMVVFLAGDTDRPMIMGAVYNGHNPPPFPLPSDKTKSGIRTRSTPEGTGHNEISFQDRSGYERVHVRAERDLDVLVRNNETRRVEANQVTSVQVNQYSLIGGNRLDSIAGNAVTSVTGDERGTVEGNRNVEIKGTSTEVMHRGSTVRVSEEMRTVVDGRELREIEGTSELRVTDDRAVRVLGNYSVVVGEADAERSTLLHTIGTAELSSVRRLDLQSDGGIELRCGHSVIHLSPDAISICSPEIGLYAGDATILLGDKKARIIAKDRALVQADQTDVRGNGASLELTDTATLHGSKIKLVGPDSARDEIEGPSEAEKTTIELKDQDGRPIPYQRFVLRIGEGKERVGVLNENGRAELILDGEGDVTVSFPDVSRLEAS